VIGEITARRDSVFSTIRTVISMKACGPWTRSTDREPTGDSTEAS